jgi:hypothetical protein
MIEVSQAHRTTILVDVKVVFIEIVNKFQLLLADLGFNTHFVSGADFVQVDTVAPALHLEIGGDNAQLRTVQEVRLLRVDDHAVSE